MAPAKHGDEGETRLTAMAPVLTTKRYTVSATPFNFAILLPAISDARKPTI